MNLSQLDSNQGVGQKLSSELENVKGMQDVKAKYLDAECYFSGFPL